MIKRFFDLNGIIIDNFAVASSAEKFFLFYLFIFRKISDGEYIKILDGKFIAGKIFAKICKYPTEVRCQIGYFFRQNS